MAVKRRPEGRSAGRCRTRGGQVVLGQSEGPPRGTASGYAPRKSRQVVRATFFAILSSSAICRYGRYGRAASHGVHARSESVRSRRDIEDSPASAPPSRRGPLQPLQASGSARRPQPRPQRQPRRHEPDTQALPAVRFLRIRLPRSAFAPPACARRRARVPCGVAAWHAAGSSPPPLRCPQRHTTARTAAGDVSPPACSRVSPPAVGGCRAIGSQGSRRRRCCRNAHPRRGPARLSTRAGGRGISDHRCRDRRTSLSCWPTSFVTTR